MTGCVAVFDLGKTNIKVVAFDDSGKVLAERGRANAPLAPDAHCPYLRLDTEGAWAFLISALKDIGGALSHRCDLDCDPRRGGRSGDRPRRRPAADGL